MSPGEIIRILDTRLLLSDNNKTDSEFKAPLSSLFIWYSSISYYPALYSIPKHFKSRSKSSSELPHNPLSIRVIHIPLPFSFSFSSEISKFQHPNLESSKYPSPLFRNFCVTNESNYPQKIKLKNID